MMLAKEYEVAANDEDWLRQIAGFVDTHGIRVELDRLREEIPLFYAMRKQKPGESLVLADAALFSRTVIVVLKEGKDGDQWKIVVQQLLEGRFASIRGFPSGDLFLLDLNVADLKELDLTILDIEAMDAVELVEVISFQPVAPEKLQSEDSGTAERGEDRDSEQAAVGGTPGGCAAGVNLGAQAQWEQIGIFDAWSAVVAANGVACGKQVPVAVIDSGFESSNLDRLSTHKNVVVEGINWEETDSLGSGNSTVDFHGTACASLIGASPQTGSKESAIGAAPESKLCLIHIRERRLPSPQHMGLALWWAGSVFGSKIISCSLGPTSGARKSSVFLNSAIDRCESKSLGLGGSLLCYAAPTQWNQARAVDEWKSKRSIVLVGSWKGRATHEYKSLGCLGVDLLAPEFTSGILGILGKGLREFPGTSASAPLVAGAAALIAGHFPQLTVPQIRDALKHGASELPDPLSGNSPPTTNKRPYSQNGWGRLDVAGALRAAARIAGLPVDGA